MSILQNAVDSIAIGLEDFGSTDQRRLISCTRNLFAGILLLFKHKLSVLSPPSSDEALIKYKVLPVFDEDQKVKWSGQGSKTVDVQGIKDRFESLRIDVDWKRIDKINKFRNDIEHYYTDLAHVDIRALISNSFLVINDFITKHLNEDPKDLLGDDAWGVMIEVNEVYEREKAACADELKSLEFFDDAILHAFEHFSCQKCGSGLISPTESSEKAENVRYICKSCNEVLSYEHMANVAIESYYFAEMYLAHTQGGELPLVGCPECGGTYLYHEGICASCGFPAKHECKRCGSPILAEELSSSPFCGYCAYMMSKDD